MCILYMGELYDFPGQSKNFQKQTANATGTMTYVATKCSKLIFQFKSTRTTIQL